MGRHSAILWGIVVAVLCSAFLVAGQAPSPSPSLSFRFPDVFLATPGKLNITAPAAPSDCAAMPATPGNGHDVFRLDPMPFTGPYWQSSEIAVTLKFVGSGDQPLATTGVNVTVKLLLGSKEAGTSSENIAAGETEPVTQTHNFPVPPGAPSTSDDVVALDVTLVPSVNGGPAPLPVPVDRGVNNVAIECGSDSKVASFTVVRGQPGESDIDGDGVPDSQDSDRDGDGFANLEEERVKCVVGDHTYRFQDEGNLAPGDHDGDKDGYTDEHECRAGSDPLETLSVPPPPKQFPWSLVIFVLVLLLLIGGGAFYVMTYGRAASLSVLSASELIVPPGSEGKFQLRVANLLKKGNPINFQLSASGAPDGWDTKLSIDHAVLDPVGGAKNAEAFWLIVEAPKHSDPESAVVTVKAIALNAAGRKDTLKLPAKARTLTSINVPPNAKVPVRRVETVQLKTDKELAEEAAQPMPASIAPESGSKEKKGKKSKGEKVPVPAAPAAAGKPQLQVGGLNHAPPQFRPGEEVKSTVTVTNPGPEAQTLKLSLYVNEALADAQTVTVKPGNSKEVKFKWTAQERNKLNIRGELVPR